MHWLPLTLISAFAYAAADTATKGWLSDYSARDLVVVRFGVTGLLLAPVLALQPWPPLPPGLWPWVAALVPFELAAMWLYMRAIREAPLYQTLPYLAFTPVITVATGWALLGERVSATGFGGIALVTAGAYLLNLEHALARRGPRALLLPFRAMLVNPGPRWMLGVAALYSLTSVLGKGALQHVPPQFFGPFYLVLLGVVVTVPYLAANGGRAGVLGGRPLALLAVGGAMAVMVYAHFLAIERVEVAYMISVKRTSLLFGILLGALFLGERHLRRNLLAGALMVAGVYLIATGPG